MPAPKFLASLPKPLLFGLYGAIGGLVGALVFGEPPWQLFAPPQAAAVQPQPEVAVSASKDVQVLVSKSNTFDVEIARAGFDGPVEVTVQGLPAGVTAEPAALVIDTGKTGGTIALNATGRGDPVTATLTITAAAKANGTSLSAKTEVTLAVTPPPPPQADVFFVLDVTGSMEWAIAGIRDGITSFAETMRAKKIDFRIGLLAFRDLTFDRPPYGPMELLKFEGQPFTTDVDAFKDKVGLLRSTGGGDNPESSLEAVQNACGQPFRKSATKVLLLITDAPPKVKPFQNEPQTEEEELAASERTAAMVHDAGIDAVNLVVRSDDVRTGCHDQTVYMPLMKAGLLKGDGKGQFFDLEESVKKRGAAGFTSLIDTFTSSVVAAAAARDPGKPVISAGADKPVLTTASLQSSQKYAEGYEGRLFLLSAVWTGAIAALVCFTLLAGQHHYLRGALPSRETIAAGLVGGLFVGLLGGTCGYGLFLLSPGGWFFDFFFRIFGWSLLGGLAGVGLAFFIPNLKYWHGLAGGAIGGAMGALGFMIVNGVVGAVIGGSFGDAVGRLAGGLILGFCIGLMVALVEAAFRSAWLEVRYGARETIAVNLGQEPVKIGGDNRACTVWARGAAPVALRYFLRGGEVVCEDATTRQEAIARDGDAREVGNVTVTVRTGAGGPSLRPGARPSPPASPPRPAAPKEADYLPSFDEEPLPVRKPAPTAPKTPEILPSFDDDPFPSRKPAVKTPEIMPAFDEEPAPRSKPPAPGPVAPATPAAPPRPAPPSAPTRPPAPVASVKPAAPAAPSRPAGATRDPDVCPSCGRKNPGRPGARYCMLCDQTY